MKMDSYSYRNANKSVKGARRPLAVLKFGFLSRFGGFAKARQAARACNVGKKSNHPTNGIGKKIKIWYSI